MIKADGNKFKPYENIWKYNCKSSVISVACTPDCTYIAATSDDAKLHLLSREGTHLWEKTLDYKAWAVAISADCNRVAVGTASRKHSDGTIFVFNRKGTEIWRYNIGSPIWGVCISGDGFILLVSSCDNKIHRFKETNGIYLFESEKKIGKKGLYGISQSFYGDWCLVSNCSVSYVLRKRNVRDNVGKTWMRRDTVRVRRDFAIRWSSQMF